jgi:hypothetical protein
MTDDAEFREAYRELLTARTPRDRRACPSPESLLAVVERRGAEATRLATLDHAMSCADCRADFQLLRTAAVSAEQAARDEAPALRLVRGGGIGHFPLRSMAVAAGLVVAVGIGLLSWHPGTPKPLLRGEEHTVVLLAPEQHADGSALLRWRTVPGAAAYRIEVFTPSGHTVVADTVRDSTFVLPAATDNAHEEQLRWMVTALHGDGHEVHSRAEQVAR